MNSQVDGLPDLGPAWPESCLKFMVRRRSTVRFR